MNKNKKIHSWYLLSMTFWSSLFIIFCNDPLLTFAQLLLIFIFYFQNNLKISTFFYVFKLALLFSLGIFILNILYPHKELQKGAEFIFLQKTFYEASLKRAAFNMVKLLSISLLSITSVTVIDYSKVILYLIVQKGLKPFYGYPLLLAMNSIVLFKKEFERIKINGRLRGLRGRDKVFIFFPLLVFAIRHSQRGALSLVTRGLNNKKSFYFSYEISAFDKTQLKLFLFFYLLLTALLLITGVNLRELVST